MQELIQRITTSLGIDEEIANKAVGMILGYIQNAGEDSAVANLIDQIPGAADMISQFGSAEPAESGDGGLMGMAMGALSSVTGGGDDGIMAVGQRLLSEGLDMGQVKNIASETIGYAKEQAGEDAVEAVTSKIPGLSAFL